MAWRLTATLLTQGLRAGPAPMLAPSPAERLEASEHLWSTSGAVPLSLSQLSGLDLAEQGC